MELVNQYIQMAVDFLSSGGITRAVEILVSLGVIDTVCRLLKTEKPMGVLVSVSAVLKGVSSLAQKLSALCLSLESLVSKLVPQRLKSPEQPK